MITEEVRALLEENLWFLATCSDEPNVVPVGFKCVTEDNKLAVGALLLETTLENIKKNNKIAISAANPATAESYQIKGTAEIITRGKIFKHYVRLAEEIWHGAMQLKCVVLITPAQLIVATPGKDNKKVIFSETK